MPMAGEVANSPCCRSQGPGDSALGTRKRVRQLVIVAWRTRSDAPAPATDLPGLQRLGEELLDLAPGLLGLLLLVDGVLLVWGVLGPHEAVPRLVDVDLLGLLAGLLEGRLELLDGRRRDAAVLLAEDAEHRGVE